MTLYCVTDMPIRHGASVKKMSEPTRHRPHYAKLASHNPCVVLWRGFLNLGKASIISFSIMIISARAGASGTQLSKIHAAHSLGASRWQILREVIFPNSLPEILTGIRVAVGMCWGTLVAAEFLAGTTGIGFVENVARKYMQYEVIWITIFVMGMLGLLFDVTIRKIIDKTIPWRGKG